ncbi:MAG: hypothetical protein U0637_13770 [Phycisphaerales bacterium]
MTTHSHGILLFSTLTLLAASATAGTVSIPEARYGVHVNALVGRQGSVAGPFPLVHGPVFGAVPATGGVFGDTLATGAGPVQPGEIVSLPGTTAIASAHASAQVAVTPLTSSTTVHLTVTSDQSVMFMDGGSYLAVGGGDFSVTFTVDQTTSYSLTGTLAMDTEDVLAFVQFIGQPVFITPGGNGPVNITGTLAPGTYTLRGNTESAAPEFPLNSGNASDSSSIDLLLTLSAVLIGPGCDPIDFNNDGLFPDTADIDDFLSVFSGGPCSTSNCADIDFNNDGLFPDTADIDALLSVFSGGPCL